MSEVLLIHGYGIGRTAPFLFQRMDKHGGFKVFEEALANGKAALFYWAVEKDYPFHQAINPREIVSFYEHERGLAADPKTLAQLDASFQSNDPKTVVCHSMGCYVFFNYLHQYALPEAVKKVIFVQGDLSKNAVETAPVFAALLEKPGLEVTNLYTPFDVTLNSSLIKNRYTPIGLRKINLPGVRNIEIHGQLPDPHVTTISKSKRLLELAGI